MKKLFIFLFLFSFTFSFLFSSNIKPAHAQFQKLKKSECLYDKFVTDKKGKTKYFNGKPLTKPTNVATLDCLPIIVGNVVFWLLIFAGVVALFLIIFGGIKLITSGGDPKQVDGARKTIVWALIGLTVIFLSFGIVRIIAQITGVKVGCLTRFGFNQCLSSNLIEPHNKNFTIKDSSIKLIS